ncbi:MAG: antibiotic biosynthesis monooxygenase family protein [Planctomycetota bacterium]|jgi:heme-degrading monooxygenase HmoA
MYIAMNRFRIAAGREEEFVRIWRERDSQLDRVPGFVHFRLLQGERGETESLLISHSEWESRAAFVAWTESEAFAQAHRSARSPEGVVLAHPEFEGYEVVA